MISFSKQRLSPIGLHLERRSAMLMQLSGKPGELKSYSAAHGEIPFDEDLSTEEQDRAVASALRKLVADHHFKGRHVVSCLGAQELFVQNVRIPKLPPEEIKKVIRWEAEERLPYPTAEAEIRYLPAAEVQQEASVKQEVILLACQQSVVERHIGILEQAGLVPMAIDTEPSAVVRSLEGIDATTETVTRRAYLNLGETATTVIFAEGNKILFLKHIAMGGTYLDQAVAEHLDLEIREAARLRSVVTESSELDADNEIHRSVIDAIRDTLDETVSEIELCLRYYKVTFRGKPLQKIVTTGSEACEWLSEYLYEKLRTPCELGNPFENLAQLPNSAAALNRPWRWSTALGLSLKQQPHYGSPIWPELRDTSS